MKKILFIDRDGTLIVEPKDTYQIDSFEKLKFIPGSIYWLSKIVRELDYDLVMVTNQDGLGTKSFPEKTFWPVQDFMINTLKGEGIAFKGIHIDKSFEREKKSTRKPGTGMLKKYMKGNYDLANSFVIGDRLTDVELAYNLGAKAVLIQNNDKSSKSKFPITLVTKNWESIYHFLKKPLRVTSHQRHTHETKIHVTLNLDGMGKATTKTGLGFLDHMLEQIAKHSLCDISITCIGDLHIDEHHTIEDVAITLGETFLKALGDKRGIERYGFSLPMDDCLAQVAIDFGGRNWIEWNAEFKREKVGDVPTEMFFHFFKSFSDAAKCNLNIQAEGKNEHHKIEAIFKAFAKCIKMAVKRDNSNQLPSTKGVL
jgi:imidazoleglycerol-phosphate dehydratase / histidinol-phosphatase